MPSIRRLNKSSLKVVFVTSSGRPDGTYVWSYRHSRLLRYIPTLWNRYIHTLKMLIHGSNQHLQNTARKNIVGLGDRMFGGWWFLLLQFPNGLRFQPIQAAKRRGEIILFLSFLTKSVEIYEFDIFHFSPFIVLSTVNMLHHSDFASNTKAVSIVHVHTHTSTARGQSCACHVSTFKF